MAHTTEAQTMTAAMIAANTEHRKQIKAAKERIVLDAITLESWATRIRPIVGEQDGIDTVWGDALIRIIDGSKAIDQHFAAMKASS